LGSRLCKASPRTQFWHHGRTQDSKLGAGPTSFTLGILAQAVPYISQGQLDSDGLPYASYMLLKAIFTDTVPSGPGPDAKVGPLELPGGAEAVAIIKGVIAAAYRPHEAKYPTTKYPNAPFIY
jgi:hypothetical protein